MSDKKKQGQKRPRDDASGGGKPKAQPPFKKKRVAKPSGKGFREPKARPDGDVKMRSEKGKGSFKKTSSNKGTPAEQKVFTKKQQKELKKERRRAKPHYDVTEEANKVFAFKFKLSDLTAEEREAKLSAVFKACEGKFKDVCMRHDSSRALQLLIKRGSATQRAAMLKEVQGMMPQLARDHHGHFLVLKFLHYCNAEQKTAIRKEFANKLRKLATHSEAASVIDYMYAEAERRDQLWMLEEFYGAEFAVFREQLDLGLLKPTVPDPEGVGTGAAAGESKMDTSSDAKAGKAETGTEKKVGNGKGWGGKSKGKDGPPLRTLKWILDHFPEKRDMVLGNIEAFVDKMADKQMLMFRFVHAVLAEYFRAAPVDRVQKMIVALAKPTSVQPLHHSAEGARILSLLILYSPVKDRKALVKTLKGLAPEYAMHPEAYLVILRALDCVDDTVLLEKSIVEDLIPRMDELVDSPSAARMFLHLLSPLNHGYFTKIEQDNIKPAEYPASADGTVLVQSTSKKDPELRRAQLLKTLLPPLLAACEKKAATMIRNATHTGSFLLYETLREGYNRSHTDSTADEKLNQAFHAMADGAVAALTAVANICSEEPGEQHVLEDKTGHYVIKRLLQNLKPDGKEFAGLLYSAVEQHLVQHANTNRGAFVLAAMIEHADEKISKQCISTLKPAAGKLKDSKGGELLVTVLNGGSASATMPSDLKRRQTAAGPKKKKQRKPKRKSDKSQPAAAAGAGAAQADTVMALGEDE